VLIHLILMLALFSKRFTCTYCTSRSRTHSSHSHCLFLSPPTHAPWPLYCFSRQPDQTRKPCREEGRAYVRRRQRCLVPASSPLSLYLPPPLDGKAKGSLLVGLAQIFCIGSASSSACMHHTQPNPMPLCGQQDSGVDDARRSCSLVSSSIDR
jgi:hypothetical protein